MKYTQDDFFENLYYKYYEELIAVVRREYWLATLAEDIVQDTFCEALRHEEMLKNHDNPGGWLMQTLKFKLLNQKRRMAQKTRAEIVADEIDNEFFASYGFAELFNIMAKELGQREAELFCLYYRGGYSARELASLEGVTEPAMKERIYRMRNRLKKILKQ